MPYDDASVLVEDQGNDIILEVASSYRPVKGISSTDQAFDFYSEYSKMGRKRPTIICGCKAQLQLKSMDSVIFEVHDFVKGHYLNMVEDCDMRFVRSTRKLTHVQEETIYELSNLNLGPAKAFNVMRTREYDAKMIVQRLCAKKTFSSDYSFEYDVNDNGELIRVFWVDEISKSKYLAFGDIISFDAIFKTNKYKMVFVPFTAIDNHCHSVTVGAGLLAYETVESYTWLLQKLLKSLCSAPKVIVTHQDPAMKQAIAFVFPNTRHRLYMWHIMKKVADNVEAELCNIEDFKRKICDIAWTDSINPSEFEDKWQTKMVEFELDKNKWLTDMYEIGCIPAFYRDGSLSRLMRITSRLDCENHFFGQATNSQLTLVVFFNHFDFCMEIHRYNGGRCDHDSRYRYPELKTRSYLEREAVRIYKRSIFNNVQDEMNEIVGGVSQFSASEEEGGYLRCKIWDSKVYEPGFLEVVFKKDGEFGEESIATCSCKNLNNMVYYFDELIKVRDKINLMIEKEDLTRYERVCPSKRDRFDAILGFEQPSEVTVRVPTGIRNKGRGSHKRVKSKKEISISLSKSYSEC
ncbi:protein FAR1-RELATED SEQUENCE 5-like [Bidens hawaiensis]|uniref:protein FAR1-RELATED SEQUENCE 5-like n=1 Tax=Bidens hawaiensis TaxID=980011 RepID=UPI0040491432